MIQSIFILNNFGNVIIEKNFRGIMSRVVVDQFWDEALKYSPFFSEVPPVITTPRYYLVHLQKYELFFLSVVARDVPPLLVLEFLDRMASIFADYFPDLNEYVLKDNFSTAYQLLDEMNDGGVPFTLEPNILQDMIEPPTIINQTTNMVLGPGNTIKDALPEGILTQIPWRRAKVKYATNEIYIDIVDEIDGIIESNGALTTCRITGRVMIDNQLSGVPDFLLRFLNSGILDDVTFHPCVRLNRWKNEQVISFVPPDGKFKLMEFRSKGNISLPLYVNPHIQFGEGTGGMTITVGPKGITDKPIEDIVITIPFATTFNGISLTSKVGIVDVDETTKVCVWKIRQLPKQTTPVLEGSFAFDTETVPVKPTISLGFTVNMWSASGLKVDSLTLLNEAYKPFKGVKSITKGGYLNIRL